MERTTYSCILWGFSIKSDIFSKFLNKVSECLEIGDIFDAFQVPLMCSLPIVIVFSREARIPMNDIRILGVVIKLVCKPSIAFITIAHLFLWGTLRPSLDCTCGQDSRSAVLGLVLSFESLSANLVPVQTQLIAAQLLQANLL